MKQFKELNFLAIRYRGLVLELKMFVPGINSGAYDKALHIQIRITEKVKRWFGIKERKIYTDITLTREQVVELRDECNKILDL